MLQRISVLHSFLLPSDISLYGYCAVLCQSLSCVQFPAAPWLLPIRLLCPWNFPSKNTGAGCHFLLQGIFLTQQSLAPPALADRFFTTAPPGKPRHWDTKVNKTLCASISSWACKGKIIMYGKNSTIETCRWYSVEGGHELRLRLAERLLDIELILCCFPNHVTEYLT